MKLVKIVLGSILAFTALESGSNIARGLMEDGLAALGGEGHG